MTEATSPVTLGENLMAVSRILTQRGAAHRRRRDPGTRRPADLTPSRSRLLIELHAGPLRIGDVARLLGVVPRTLTPMVDSLEAAGLLERVADPADRRATLLRVTDAGSDALDESRRASFAVIGQAFEALDDVEREQLAAILRRLLDTLGEPSDPKS